MGYVNSKVVVPGLYTRNTNEKSGQRRTETKQAEPHHKIITRQHEVNQTQPVDGKLKLLNQYLLAYTIKEIQLPSH
jgi:hypothetical protein